MSWVYWPDLRISSGIRTAFGLILKFATCSATLFPFPFALSALGPSALSSCAPLLAWELRGRLLAKFKLVLPNLGSAALASCAPLMAWGLLGNLPAEVELCCALSGLGVSANAVQNTSALDWMHIWSERRTARGRPRSHRRISIQYFANPLIDLLIRFVILAFKFTHLDVVEVDWQLIFLIDLQ